MPEKTKRYRLKSGKHWPRDDKGNVMEPAKAGQTVELNERQAKNFGDLLESSASGEGAEKAQGSQKSQAGPAAQGASSAQG